MFSKKDFLERPLCVEQKINQIKMRKIKCPNIMKIIIFLNKKHFALIKDVQFWTSKK